MPLGVKQHRDAHYKEASRKGVGFPGGPVAKIHAPNAGARFRPWSRK